VVVEKGQVKAIFEIKAWIDQSLIFGRKSKDGTRKADSGLASAYQKRKHFLPAGARYILFAFSLSSSSKDTEVLKRLSEKQICDSYAIVLRWEPKVEQVRGKEIVVYNFDDSVSRLIEWLRNLS